VDNIGYISLLPKMGIRIFYLEERGPTIFDLRAILQKRDNFQQNVVLKRDSQSLKLKKGR